jgi:hypothetical protein
MIRELLKTGLAAAVLLATMYALFMSLASIVLILR